MAKVYLSFLGTSDYVECIYHQGTIEERNVRSRFVQIATLKFFSGDWTADDRVLIFTTDEAYRKNWLDNGHEDQKTKIPIKCDGLECCISGLKLAAKVERIPIREGKSEAEIWEIFSNVFDCLNEGDEVVFDITHALRSIPMLAIVILNYAKVMKGIKLFGIYYGAFEVIGTPPEARNKPIEERRAPILDLTAFDKLLEWSFAVDRFLGAGDAGPVSELAKTSVKPFLASSRGQDDTAKTIQRIASGLDEFTRILATCRAPMIADVARSLKENVHKYESLELIKPFKPIVEKIKNQMAGFQGHIVLDGIRASRWCLEHNLIQQGFTILQETLLTYFVMEINGDPFDKVQRSLASQAATIESEGFPFDDWMKPSSDFPDIVEQHRSLFRSRPELMKLFRNLTDFRNDLNHAAYRKPSKPEDAFFRKLEDFVGEAETLLMH